MGGPSNAQIGSKKDGARGMGWDGFGSAFRSRRLDTDRLDMVSRPVARPVDDDPLPVRRSRAQPLIQRCAAVRMFRASLLSALVCFLCCLLCSRIFPAHVSVTWFSARTTLPCMDLRSSPCLAPVHPSSPHLHRSRPRAACLSNLTSSCHMRAAAAVPSLHAPLRAPRPCSSPHLCSADQCSWFSSRDRSEFPPHAPCVAPTF